MQEQNKTLTEKPREQKQEEEKKEPYTEKEKEMIECDEFRNDIYNNIRENNYDIDVGFKKFVEKIKKQEGGVSVLLRPTLKRAVVLYLGSACSYPASSSMRIDDTDKFISTAEKLKSLFSLSEEEFMRALKDSIRISLSSGYLSRIKAIISHFNLSADVLKSPDIQARALKVIRECSAGANYANRDIEIESGFGRSTPLSEFTGNEAMKIFYRHEFNRIANEDLGGNSTIQMIEDIRKTFFIDEKDFRQVVKERYDEALSRDTTKALLGAYPWLKEV